MAARAWERCVSFGGFKINWKKSGALMLWGTREAKKAYKGVESIPLPRAVEGLRGSCPEAFTEFGYG